MHFFQIKFTVSLFLSQFKTQRMRGVAILDSVGRPSLHSRIGWPDPSATQLKNTCGISHRITGMVTNTIYLFFFQKRICRTVVYKELFKVTLDRDFKAPDTTKAKPIISTSRGKEWTN